MYRREEGRRRGCRLIKKKRRRGCRLIKKRKEVERRRRGCRFIKKKIDKKEEGGREKKRV